MKEGVFFQDIAVLMSVVGIVSIVFTKLRWPKVIGYLFAGMLMSANTWGGSFLVDETSVSTIGQLGIVFLMFGLGLGFSGSEMKKIGHVTVPTAVFDVAMMIWIGYTAGRHIFGWGSVPSLFLGAAICDSATTLLTKTIDEMKWTKRPFVRYIFGTTIFEDILCVGVIALVTGVAQGRGMSLVAAGRSLGGLAVFFTGVLVFGLILIPRIFNGVARLKDDETLLLTALGACFLVSFIAARLDFSLALGAFLMGILGASSDVRSRIHSLMAPLGNMFAAVFFVTIGLLVDPVACFHHLPAILGLAALIVLGKGLNCFVMSILTGQSVKDAVQTGLGLAQIGEFAYMVALMYMTLTNDMSNPMYQIVVGASLITTCLNPVLIRFSDPLGGWLEDRMPLSVKAWLKSYNDWLQKYRSAFVPTKLLKHIRSRVVWLAALGALNVAVAVLATMLSGRDYSRFSGFFEAHKRTFFSLAVNLYFASMVAPAAGLARSLGRDIALVLTGKRSSKRWKSAVNQFLTWAVTAATLVLFFVEIMMLNLNILPDDEPVCAAIALFFIVVAVFGWKRFARAGRVAGYRFNSAVQAEKRRAARGGAVTTLSVPTDFYGKMPIGGNSQALGRSIRELDIRAKTGASVVSVERSGERHRNPGPEWKFAEGDVVVAIGEPMQLAALRKCLAGGEGDGLKGKDETR